MRKFTRRATALLAAGVLAVATAAPVHAQTSHSDITVPLGGSCVVNLTQLRIDGDCSLQFIGGAIAATLAVFGLGSLGAGSSNNTPPIVTPTTVPTTPEEPDPTTTVPTTPEEPDPTTTVPTTPEEPDPEVLDPRLRSSYRLVEETTGGSVTLVRVEYLGQSTVPGLLSLDRVSAGGSRVGLDEGKTLSEGVEGYYANGTHGEFILTYSVDNQSVEVGRWSY